MSSQIDAYLEIGQKKVFAAAVDWPGWCRAGREEGAALQALADYGKRYKSALGRVATNLKVPGDVDGFVIVERLKGDASTEFGVPGKVPALDDRSIAKKETDRLSDVMKAVWSKFDRTAKAHNDSSLRKGPRGGGRDLDKIINHVVEGEMSYLYRLGGKFYPAEGAELRAETLRLRKEFLEMLRFRAAGKMPPMGKRTAKLWPPPYAVRRAAWHVLDHAWEIEDRAE